MARRELRDDQWKRIKELLPGKASDPGRTATDNRKFVDAVLWIARTGAHWRELPAASVPGTPYSSGTTDGRTRAYGSACSEPCPAIPTLNM